MPLAVQIRLPFGAAHPLGSPAVAPYVEVDLPPSARVDQAEPDAAGPRVVFVRNPRARRYVLRVRDDGTARVTIPRGGSMREGERFYRANGEWVARQRERLGSRGPSGARDVAPGDRVWLRGVHAALVRISLPPHGAVRLADQTVALASPEASVRSALAGHLRALAARELPGRLLELATGLGLRVSRVAVRDQRSRWGSCSPGGAISLNWRLVQMPGEVRDYVMLHELMHLRRLDHSRAFWRMVREVCPWYRDAHLWLRRHGRELL